MNMDWQSLFNFALTAGGTLFGWVLRMIWAAQEQLRADLKTIERGLPATYVRRDEFREHSERVEAALMRIEDKLDRKADR